ncbi:MAG: hypothetical protein JKX98_11920 [Alcanivoracaceae bacterium]|nr:hypothetical protein [Alcanivoracaceae bacterium]
MKNKKKCILHIGLHKTGTSSLQLSLHSSLNDKQHTYLNLFAPNHSERLYSLFVENPENYHMNKRKGLSKNQIDRINLETKEMFQNSFNSSASETMIISAEDISVLTLPALKKLKVFLLYYFYEITIVAYVRSPFSYISSSFQEGVKAGWNDFNISKLYPNYRNKLEKFDIVFDKEKVHIWEFNRQSLFQNDVVQDFCYRLGIILNKENVIRSNNSLSKETLSLLYIYYKFGPGYGIGPNVQTENNLLIENLRILGNTRFNFSSTLVKSIIDSNIGDIRWIESRMGRSFINNFDEDEKGVFNESNLVNVHSDLIKSLCLIIGKDHLPVGNNGQSFEEIANLIHALRIKLVKKHL